MFDAVVLAGGSSRRMGSDKPALYVGELTLLDRVLTACAAAQRTVVVGPSRDVSRDVVWTREEPPGGGPVPALRAGLELVEQDVVVVLAADLPFLSPSVVDDLVARTPAVVVGDDRPQWLCGAWPTAALRTALQTDEARLGTVLRALSPALVAAVGWEDCDTPEDLARARERT